MTRTLGPFPLGLAIRQLAHAHRLCASKLLGSFRLRPGQDLLIIALGQHGPQSQSDIARKIGVDRSTIAKSLMRLELADLIRRDISDQDPRANIVSLTRRGSSLYQSVDATWATLEAALAGTLTENGDTMTRAIERLRRF
jgi:MarR family transcriptional regulator, organic hydroperoxide resistance regulator